ncbi:hypothetical protein C0993_008179, partial [Termitomyces sp. T159_Od127]
RSLVLFFRTPGTCANPRHSSFPLPGTRPHPPALPALLYAPFPAPLRSPTPRATPGALCSCTVNCRKVDSPSRLSPRGQRNLTEPWAQPLENKAVNKFVDQMKVAQEEAKAALAKAKDNMA